MGESARPMRWHGPAGVYGPGRLKCDGSYKLGRDS